MSDDIRYTICRGCGRRWQRLPLDGVCLVCKHDHDRYARGDARFAADLGVDPEVTRGVLREMVESATRTEERN